MNLDARCTLKARMACLDGAIAFIDAFCKDHAVGDADRLRLTLVVEELWTNTVMHGHGADAEATVDLGLAAEPTQLLLEYVDRALPFDPRGRVEPADAEAVAPEPSSVSEALRRPVGGLGLALVAGLVAGKSYAYVDGENRLRLVLRRQG